MKIYNKIKEVEVDGKINHKGSIEIYGDIGLTLMPWVKGVITYEINNNKGKRTILGTNTYVTKSGLVTELIEDLFSFKTIEEIKEEFNVTLCDRHLRRRCKILEQQHPDKIRRGSFNSYEIREDVIPQLINRINKKLK